MTMNIENNSTVSVNSVIPDCTSLPLPPIGPTDLNAIIPSRYPFFELTWEKIRTQRNAFLANSDWAVLPDATPKPSKQEWLDYRQQLRNITQDFDSPEKVVWPEQPE